MARSAKTRGDEAMTDEPEHIDVPIDGPTLVEIDAERIARIILSTCHTTATGATRASNLILEYLAEAFQAAGGPQ
jgi:hypothetical protein